MTKKIDALVDEAMSQAQVFASAWSLVGGKFDNGEMLENAEVEKRALRALIADILSASISDRSFISPLDGRRIDPDALDAKYRVSASIADTAGAKDQFAEYRRGVMEAFHRANMINANRQDRTVEETCAYLVRSLAELANGYAATPAPSVADAQVDDLRMLVQRLVHALNKASPSNDLGAKALDYLQRNGIGPSPLRESSVADAAGAKPLLNEDQIAKEWTDIHGSYDEAARPTRRSVLLFARSILATRDTSATPVAWMTYSAFTGEPQFTKHQTSELASVPLYAAPPAPSVADAGLSAEQDALKQKGLDDHLARQEGKREDGWKGSPDLDKAGMVKALEDKIASLSAENCAAPSVADAAGASESAIYDAMVQCCEIHGYEIEPEVIDMLSRSVVSAATKEPGE